MPFEGLFSPLHWLIVAVVALLVLGPKEIPNAARTFGRVIRQIREVRDSLTADLHGVGWTRLVRRK